MTDTQPTHTPSRRAQLIHATLPIFAGVAVAGIPGVADAATATVASASKTYVGKVVQQHYGPVQVKITVSKGRMTKVTATAPEDYARSKEINAHAVPVYDSDALKAQKVSGVHKITGASLTFEAFEASLADAMKEAHLHGA